MTSKATHAKKSAKQSSNTISNLDKVTYRERVLECGLKLDRSFNSVLYVTFSFDLSREDGEDITILVEYGPGVPQYHIYEGIYPNRYTFLPERGERLESGDEISKSILLSNYPEIIQYIENIKTESNEDILDRLSD